MPYAVDRDATVTEELLHAKYCAPKVFKAPPLISNNIIIHMYESSEKKWNLARQNNLAKVI